MVNTRLIQRSFSGGELSPEMFGRMDSAVYQNGASLMRNFIARPQGPAAKRPGFRWVASTKGQGTTDTARVLPFTYSTTQTMVIEMGAVRNYTGVSTAVTFSSITVATASWTVNQFVNQRVWCNGSNALVASNTATTITLASGWTPSTPTVGQQFFVESCYLRFHTQGQTLYTGTSGISSWSSLVNISVIVPSGGTTFTSAGHSFVDGNRVYLTGAAITGGSIQPGTSNVYYVVNSTTNTFQLSSTLGGTALTTGTPSLTYTVTRQFAVGDLVNYSGYGWYCLTAHATVTTPSTTATTWYRMGTWGALGSVFEIWSPFAGPDILDVHFAQSEDVVTLTHSDYYPYELQRFGATYWVLSPIGWQTAAGAPTLTGQVTAGRRQTVEATSGTGTGSIITVTSNGTTGYSLVAGDTVYIRGTGVGTLDNQWFMIRSVNGANSTQMSLNYLLTGVQWTSASTLTVNGTIERIDYRAEFTNKYVATAVFESGAESAASSSLTLSNGLYSNGNTNALTCATVSGATQYRFYKLAGGIYGLIGSSTNGQFTDDNITPDLGVTPPIYLTPTPLATSGYYPSTVGFFEQRRCFAGSLNEPQTFYATRSGTDSDMSYRFPSQSDDRLKFKIRAREVNSIRHIVPLNELLLLTSSAEWRVSSINSDVLTPDSISIRPQSYVGSSNVQPEIVNNSLVFCSARGGHVRELGYNWQSQGFVTSDLSIRAAHLFDHETITDMCMSRSPHPIVWFVSTTGNLLGLTYIPEEQVASWHQHTTSGKFKSCCAVAEGDEDILYVITERTVGGTFSRFVERLAEQKQPTDLKDSYFVDCGSYYSGTPVTIVSGLTWLEGATVKVLADGKVHRDLVVSGFSITLDYPASTVQVGLGYSAELQTLPVAMQTDGLGQGRTKNVNRAWLRMVRSSGVMIGPDSSHVVKSNLYDGVPQTVRTDEVEVVLSPSWSRDGRIYVLQSDPLPIVITNLTVEISIGS